ncbi:MAG: DNA polymerase III subunit delta' [Thermodesulfobacteriota bacterium]
MFQPFSKIIGQDKVVQFLKGALLKETLPHAFLFVGMPGVGRTTTAIALTQALNCLEPARGEGCGLCRTCRRFIQKGGFEDLVIVEPEKKTIGIEQIRDLERSLGFKPHYGRYRVTVVREAEQMTEQASNAFLKTLEEPPAGNILILNAVDPSRLLPTIVSRCQQVAFRPIPVSLMAPWLAADKGMNNEDALLLAKLSEGSLGKAIDMWENDYLEKRKDCLSKVMGFPALSDQDILQMALDLARKGKRDGEGGEERGGGEIPLLLGLWKTWIRDLLVLKAGGAPEWLIHSDYAGPLKKDSGTRTIDSLLEALSLLNRAEMDLSKTRNVELMMENLLLAMRRLDRLSIAAGKTGEGTLHG